MKKINWGRLYDRHAACLQCKPVCFCGCRWENIEWCYECLNDSVKGKSFVQKLWILVQLNFITLNNNIKCRIRMSKHRKDKIIFL